MRVWFGSMNGPTRLFWLYAASLGAATGLSPAGELSGPSDLASRGACALVLVLWVMRGAQQRRIRLRHDYGSFVFFLWPVVVPTYLFQTRGWRAFVTLGCVAGILSFAVWVSLVIFGFRELGVP